MPKKFSMTKKELDECIKNYGLIWAFNLIKLNSGVKQPLVITDYRDIDALIEKHVVDYKPTSGGKMFTPYYSKYVKLEEEVKRREDRLRLLREKAKASSSKPIKSKEKVDESKNKEREKTTCCLTI